MIYDMSYENECSTISCCYIFTVSIICYTLCKAYKVGMWEVNVNVPVLVAG